MLSGPGAHEGAQGATYRVNVRGNERASDDNDEPEQFRMQFQRFRALQGTSSGELHATFGECHP